mgnify:FL=1
MAKTRTDGPTKAAGKAAKPKAAAPSKLLTLILKTLDDDKAENIVAVDLMGRSSVSDSMVVASGRSARHVSSLAENLARKIKSEGFGIAPIEGLRQGDWVLVDAGDVVVHLFRPEVREFYNLESMWSGEHMPTRAAG